MEKKWMAYSDRGHLAVEDDTPYSYAPKNTRGVMRELNIWTSIESNLFFFDVDSDDISHRFIFIDPVNIAGCVREF